MADNFGRMTPTSSPGAASSLPPAPAVPSWLHDEVASRMAERLGLITVPVRHWAAWGLGRGGGLAALRARYPQAQGLAWEPGAAAVGALQRSLDQQAGWRRWLPGALRRLKPPPVRVGDATTGVAPAGATPLVDLVWANLVLDELGGADAIDAKAMLQAWHGQLAVGGFVMFTCFGPDTARELRSMARAQGWCEAGQVAADFTDMHDWGDRLVSEGFADPVMDMEQLTLTYADGPSLARDLRALGWAAQAGGAMGLQALEALPGGEAGWRALGAPVRDGRFVLTVELVYGHAFKPAPRLKLAGETRFSVDELRAALASSPSPATRRNPRQ
jgi:malonyl-CoA O-methyltransferase